MKLVDNTAVDYVSGSLPEATLELTETDEERFLKVVSDSITPVQNARITAPDVVYKRQKEVLAIHWHPEFIPLDLIAQRIDKLFPDRSQELIIPTQHNVMMKFNGFAGVEVDCYSSGFKRKVQLLLHFEASRVKDAGILNNILNHTFRYRSSQLHHFIGALTKPRRDWLEDAARETGASSELIEFITLHTHKIEKMLDKFYDRIPPASIKNKLLRNYFDELQCEVEAATIIRIQTFLKVLKNIVKSSFPLKFFYRTSEIIEEVRGLGGGVVIPHPEQFWPILLADYDIDGYEIWNPQSREYTEFLISVLKQRNRSSSSKRRVLAFMGDDTHFGEKVKEPALQNRDKAAREIGVQPPWSDLAIQKELIKAGFDRPQVIEEYRARLVG